MKLGLSTDIYAGGYARYGEGCFAAMREDGYEAIDYNMADTDGYLYTLSDAERERVLARDKRAAAEAGVEIRQVHGPWRWPARDREESDRAERMEKMKLCIRMTALLGCRYFVVHPIMPFGTEELGTPDEEKTWEMNLAFMRELLETAKAEDVVICLENMPMPRFSIGSVDRIIRLVDRIDDDHFRICLDTGHVSVYDSAPVGPAVRLAGKRIRAFHVHDNTGWSDMHLMPYYGVIDWADFAQSLRDIGYDETVCMESTVSGKLSEELFREASRLNAKIGRRVLNG